MTFKEPEERFIYQKNPIAEVILQIRFPPILRIESELPSEFQEQIREHFPEYHDIKDYKQNFNIGFDSKTGPTTPVIDTTSSQKHTFLSADRVLQIDITRNYISFSTIKYETWEQFIEAFKIPLKSFISIYAPSFYTRIGLRYIDIFCRSNLGETDTDWKKFIKDSFLGILAIQNEDVRSNISNFKYVYEIKLTDPADSSNTGLLHTKASFAYKTNNAELENLPKEKCFHLDSDFSVSEKIPLEMFEKKITFLHSQAKGLLSEVITPYLHNLMEPKPL
jgi:hypothetical protein